jgi:hypothetical protein
VRRKETRAIGQTYHLPHLRLEAGIDVVTTDSNGQITKDIWIIGAMADMNLLLVGMDMVTAMVLTEAIFTAEIGEETFNHNTIIVEMVTDGTTADTNMNAP